MERTLLLSAHIIAVAAWLGADLVLLVLGRLLAGVGNDVAAVWHDKLAWLSQRYFNVVGMVVALTGALLVVRGPYSWGAGFVGVGLLTVVVAAVVGAAVIGPAAKGAAHAYRGGTPTDPDALQPVDLTLAGRLSNRLSVALLLDAALVMVTVAAMVHKWRA